uniref:1,3-beta-glucan synthase n=1 Tax=Oryza brachyantha TaxID=4533 RepID=J3LBB7_ORYBR
MMDPRSTGRGVRQFKTALLQRLEQDEKSTFTKRMAKSDSQEIRLFCEKKIQANELNELMPVLGEVLKAVQIGTGMEKRIATETFADKSALLRYNILPLYTGSNKQAIMLLPEIKVAVSAVFNVRSLPFSNTKVHKNQTDIFIWIQSWFGFQLDDRAVDELLAKTFENYLTWCKFLGRKSNIWLPSVKQEIQQHKLLYIALYLLIWGEASNLRLMPECLCYIFHHMSYELYGVLSGAVSLITGEKVRPAYGGDDESFLNKVVTPIYREIYEESLKNKNGVSDHSTWRNYDDLNEFFWSADCFKLGWPMRLNNDFFFTSTKKKNPQLLVVPPVSVNTSQQTEQQNPQLAHGSSPFQTMPNSEASEQTQQRAPSETSQQKWLGKTNFVEVRSFWHIFRSFDRMWTLLVLGLQVLIIMAWHGLESPVQLIDPIIFQDVLSIFITNAVLRVIQVVAFYLTSNVIGMAFFLVPAVSSFLETSTWRICNMLAWWCQIKPLVEPTKEIMKVNVNKYEWHEFFPQGASYALDTFALNSVYFMDTQIWYSVFCTIFGDDAQFQNLGKAERHDPTKFALVWNQIINSFRSEDLISNREMDLMTMPMSLEHKSGSIRWPMFLLAKKFSEAVDMVANFTGKSVHLFRKIKKDNYMLCAINDFYELTKSILKFLVIGEVEKRIIAAIYTEIEKSIQNASLLDDFRMDHLPSLVDKFDRLAQLLKIHSIEQNDMIIDEYYSAFECLIGPFALYDLGPLSYFLRIEVTYSAKGYYLSQSKYIQDLIDRSGIIDNRTVAMPMEHDLQLRPDDGTPLEDPSRYCHIVGSLVYLTVTRPNLGDFVHILNQFFSGPTSVHYDHLLRVLTYLRGMPSRGLFYAQSSSPKIHAYSDAARASDPTERGYLIILGSFPLTWKTKNPYCLGPYWLILMALYILHSLMTNYFPNPKNTNTQELQYEVTILLQDIIDILVQDMFVDAQSVLVLINSSKTLISDDHGTFEYYKPELFASINSISENGPLKEQVKRLYLLLNTKEKAMEAPSNLEARRRISFFATSLFMDMPLAPKVRFSEDELHSDQDEASVLSYMQKIYPDEWKNFLERLGPKVTQEEIRYWASFRGQTLSRTVRGMMYYRKALRLQAFLDKTNDQELFKGPAANGRQTKNMHPSLGTELDALADMKFSYVISCQKFGEQKSNGDPHAQDIIDLMTRYPALRVAYIEEKEIIVNNRPHKVYSSVLIKAENNLDQEIYRIKLPGPPLIGEGKPENQNHAIIFTRGEALQTIDMNQDNYLEEAYKMRNVLQEFVRHPRGKAPTILGLREHIFTGSVSSLAGFMSYQETSFVTIGQRFLADPLRVRFHYGHPDIFDRMFHLTRGGISKASKTINLSEDVFAGYNSILRRGHITYNEYIQVGKGRDVGLNQISKFEAKVANGNSEQTLSRDIHRLGRRFDFFRMLSCYFTTVGFYFNSLISVVGVYVFLYGQLYLVLSGLQRALLIEAQTQNMKSLETALVSQSFLQLGLLTGLPMVMELGLEKGFRVALSDFILMQLQLASVFFTFSLGTKAHYYGRTILHGGAKYRPTGRKFVAFHASFTENYQLYSRSHFVKGFELVFLLIIYHIFRRSYVSTAVHVMITYSTWFMAVTWLFAPFLFNPAGFAWRKIVEDWADWTIWMRNQGGIGVQPEKSWESWWNAENAHLRHSVLSSRILEVLLSLRFFIYQYGLVYHLKISQDNKNFLVYLLSWVVIIAIVGLVKLVNWASRRLSSKHQLVFRLIKLLIFLSVMTSLILLSCLCQLSIMDLIICCLAFIPTGWGLLLIVQVLRPKIEYYAIWEPIQVIAHAYDYGMGSLLFFPIAALAWMPVISAIQTRVLFNRAFSRQLQIQPFIAGKTKRRFSLCGLKAKFVGLGPGPG